MAERVEGTLTFLLILRVKEHMTSMSIPSRLGHFVVEQSATKSFSKLLPSKPL
jgi:hypothetical protein